MPVPFPSLEKHKGLLGREDSLTCFVSCKHFLVFLSHPRTGVGFLEMELQNHPRSCSATSLPYSCNLNKFSGFTGPESDGIVHSICSHSALAGPSTHLCSRLLRKGQRGPQAVQLHALLVPTSASCTS